MIKATQSQEDHEGLRQGDLGCPSGWRRESLDEILGKGTSTIIKLSYKKHFFYIYIVYT